MFRGGRSKERTEGKAQGTGPRLSPPQLRDGLRARGLPLGDQDFAVLLARVDQERRGEVSYGDFCGTLKLKQMRNEHPEIAVRPSSAPTTTGATIGYGYRGPETCVDDRRVRGSEGFRGKAAPALGDSLDLDGGLFHLNPFTSGWPNPNFTTTMIPPTDKSGDGPLGYRPSRRQSPASAPGSRLTGVRPGTQGQTLHLFGDESRLWGYGSEEAEADFRRALGKKSRYARCYLGSLGLNTNIDHLRK